MRPVSLVSLAAAMTIAVAVAGCNMPEPNDAEIGCAYDAHSSPLCPAPEASMPDASDAPDAAVATVDAEQGDTGATEAGLPGDAGSGLGASCNAPSDCSSLAADYCLVSPTGTFPSFCTYTHCTGTACGANYVCCDCTMSPVSLVNTFPPGICVLPMTAAALPSYGCTCAPPAQ